MSSAAEIHDALGHPVIDADGHGIEYLYDNACAPWGKEMFDRS